MRVRSRQLRAGDEFFSTIVVKPPLARLEARDYRMTRSGVMFRCMLVWRTITAADVPAFGASAKMQPPRAPSQAFDAACSARLGRRVDAIPLVHRLQGALMCRGVCVVRFVWWRLAVSNARIALPDFYNIAVRIANVAARLTVFGLRLRDELGSSTSPKFVTRLNIRNADIHKAVD